MYRTLPATGRVASRPYRAVRVVKRRLTTDSGTIAPPKKKRSIVRRILFTTTALGGTFYVGSTFVSFHSQAYYDFFSEKVPFGQEMIEYGEANHWDRLTVSDVIEAGTDAAFAVKHFVTDLYNGTSTSSAIVEEAKQSAEKKGQEAKESVKPIVEVVKTKVDEVKETAKQDAEKVEASAKEESDKVVAEVKEGVEKAEVVLTTKPTEAPAAPAEAAEPVKDTQAEEAKPDPSVYVAPLPVGFEPPPGYSRPAPKKVAPPPQQADAASTPTSESVNLPLVAPAVSSLGESEPIISHLAGTIDNLASYLASNPTAASKATDVLETAKTDLTALAERIDKAREEERVALEAKLDEQTRAYTVKLMELEMEAQDKLDSQEEGFRKFFEEERAKLIQAYRAKLDQELRTQTDLINERLKEEVIAQGIELQRRWIREIKVRVELERGGRLAKLDELSAGLKRLESIALDNSSYLDENIRVHSLWSAIRALHTTALTRPERQPFRDELRRLRHIASAKEDPVVHTALESLEASDVPDYGVEPFADLATWFTSKVSPRVAEVALVPEENAGVLTYLASRVLSGLRFKRTGLVEGDDVLSVLARAEHHLNEKNLDSAARELNQLRGPAKVLLQDWLQAARRRLEVQQALEIVQTQATLASLLVI
ncbi:hypothetical protein AX16_009153 [Volvariella volvacea WC 439]|nr:hypothetical protein AX16_009153 [Volvariella volvacea WC 439]